jgi:hypothetical protein
MSKQPFFGPNNSHPLSTLSTELIWKGKYAIQVLYDSMEDLGADMTGMVRL